MRRVVWLGYAVYLLLGWTSALVPALVFEIEASFGRTDAAIGLLYLAGAVLYGVGGLGLGVVAERYGANRVLAGALTLLAVGLLVQSWVSLWALFVAASAVGKGGGGGADAGVGAMFLRAFPVGRGGALSRLHLFYGVGGLLGPAAVGLAVTLDAGWRPIFVGTAVVSLSMAALAATTPESADPGRPAVEPETDSATDEAPPTEAERSLRPFAWLAVAIACYESAAAGVAGWLVRFLSDESVRLSTGALSLFWAGICLARLGAPWVARRMSTTTFSVASVVGMSVALAAAVLAPSAPLAAALFGLTGLFAGPIYPMLIAIGGDLYPRRLAALSGGMTAAATVGVIVYPPLMGLAANRYGIGAGLLGAAALGGLAAVAVVAATRVPTAGRARSSPA